MESSLTAFLRRHADLSLPVVLGLSGGADSLALLHLLLKDPIGRKLRLHIAHVDHRWREESAQEAAQLEQLAQELRLPFHLEVLNPAALQGNLEGASREARLDFFHRLCQRLGAQAVLLGHHADDQGETLLTRVLEGHSIVYLQGMQPVSSFSGVTLWRPFLAFRKEEINKVLQESPFVPFEDYTNFDPKFMRGRLRTKILPDLTRSFGKEITSSLCRLGEESFEFREYLEEKIAPWLRRSVKGPWGVFLEVGDLPPHRLEGRHLIRRFCEQQGFAITRSLVETVWGLLQDRAANKQVAMGGFVLRVDRGGLFLFHEPFLPWEGECEVRPGEWEFGGWRISVTPFEGEEEGSGWREVVQGHFWGVIPEENCRLALPVMTACYRGNSPVSKWWTDHHVPAFIRKAFPVVWKGDRIVCEFLTGNRIENEPKWSIRGTML